MDLQDALRLNLQKGSVVIDDLQACGWENVAEPKDLPLLPGVYAIFGSDNGKVWECLYVGKSSASLRLRLVSQHAPLHRALSVFPLVQLLYKAYSIVKTDSDIQFDECLAIGMLRPLWNAQAKTPVKLYPKCPECGAQCNSVGYGNRVHFYQCNRLASRHRISFAVDKTGITTCASVEGITPLPRKNELRADLM